MEDFKNTIIAFTLLLGLYLFFTRIELGQEIVANVLLWFQENPLFKK